MDVIYYSIANFPIKKLLQQFLGWSGMDYAPGGTQTSQGL